MSSALSGTPLISAPTASICPHDTFLSGDALTQLRTLPDACVQTCVTSPPYYGLRDYGVPGQIGLEESPDAYVTQLVAVFREVRRVLRDDGTLFLNLGDSYAGSWGNYAPRGITSTQRPQSVDGQRWKRRAYDDATQHCPPTAKVAGLKSKDLIGIPWRVAFALQTDGWYLRSDIIWQKPNPMPESVADRPTRSHEYVFLFSKRERYYYDALSVAEPAVSDHGSGNGYQRGARLSYRDEAGPRGSTQQWEMRATRNRRDVWSVPVKPYRDAHFAVMPEALADLCIRAGCSARACERCGAPWRRQTHRATRFEGGSGRAGRDAAVANAAGKWAGQQHGQYIKLGPVTETETTGWEATCRCGNATGSAASVVLDPFSGAGTVAVVARRHGRHYLGIELNPDYNALAEARLRATPRASRPHRPAPAKRSTSPCTTSTPTLWEVGA